VSSGKPTLPIANDFVRRITDWQRRAGRHDLPWQGTGEAYRVWLSEVMLQQTQVATVVPAFQRFVGRFPDVASLARAPLDEVLGLWSGLGYYSRARNLHRAAREIVAQGGFPGQLEGLMRLPGVGRSTAAAIVSLAFDRPAAILDGNVRRVLARHAGIDGWPGDPAVTRRLWAEAESRLPPPDAPPGAARAYTQGLMDLGAGVCHRRHPACGACPLAGDCAAHRHGLVARIPAPRPPRQRPWRRIALLLDAGPDGVLLVRRPERGVWGGLWCLPEGGADEPWYTLRHDLTHLRLEIVVAQTPRDRAVQSAADEPESGAQRFAWDEVWPLGLPQPVRDILHMARERFGAGAAA